MKVQLVQPPIGKYLENSRTGSYLPLGLVSIATYLKRHEPQLDVEILDGEIVSMAEICDRINGDFVGITANTVTYPQAIEIATVAKSRSAKVILGGVYASALYEKILDVRNDIIDTVVVGYGERPMLDIIHGNTQRIIFNYDPPFNEIPFPDRSLLIPDDYFNIFRQNYPTWNHKATNVFTNVGCYWREFNKGGCIFCSRSGDITMFRNPVEIWKEVRVLVEQYQVNYIIDFSDTILQNSNWLKTLVDAKPKDINPLWHVFGRADEISDEKIRLLKKLNCIHIFVGLESGDPRVYKQVYKGGGNPAENIKVVSLLTEHGIEITPSYVTGLPGETKRSLQNTYDHVKRVKEISGFEEIFCCELIPFPGSKAFSLIQPFLPALKDCFDIELLKQAWASNFCNVDFPVISEYTSKILDLADYKITIKKCHTEENTLSKKSNLNTAITDP